MNRKPDTFTTCPAACLFQALNATYVNAFHKRINFGAKWLEVAYAFPTPFDRQGLHRFLNGVRQRFLYTGWQFDMYLKFQELGPNVPPIEL